MLNLERLRALAAVAEHGSIAQAARALHVTPSGLSQQLNKLEREIGHRLLEPQGRTVRLTHPGRVLTAHAAELVSHVRAAEADLADLQGEVLGPLRVGAVGSTIRAMLPPVLAALTRDHPRLSPTVRDGEVIDMMPLLLNGDLDAVLSESWANRPMALPEGVALRLLAGEDAHLALPVRHPLSERACVDLTELHAIVWASCAPGTEPREALTQALRTCGIEPDVRYSVADHPTQLELVAAGLTAALIPAMGQRSVPPGVRFIPTRPALRREIHVLWRTPAANPAIGAFVEALRLQCGENGGISGLAHRDGENRGQTGR